MKPCRGGGTNVVQATYQEHSANVDILEHAPPFVVPPYASCLQSISSTPVGRRQTSPDTRGLQPNAEDFKSSISVTYGELARQHLCPSTR